MEQSSLAGRIVIADQLETITYSSRVRRNLKWISDFCHFLLHSRPIRDVSNQAGVSPATVSRVFNTPEAVRPELRVRVQAAAAALGYRPNAHARSLRTQRTQAIGVVLPTLLNPVFAECLQGIAERMAEFLAARLVISGPPTAVVCSNDLLAIRCIRAAHLIGIHVPADLSVAGFDGIGLGQELTPALSTVVQPNTEIGRSTVELLVQALSVGIRLEPQNSLTLDLHFREGESIAAARIPTRASSISQPRRIST